MTSALPIIAGLGPGALAVGTGAVLLAAFVRGYSGFGLSALAITGLALVIPPAEAVPLGILFEVLASLMVAHQVWHKVAWREIGLLLLAASCSMPLGIALLVLLPSDVMRLVISAIVLAASALLWAGPRNTAPKGRGTTRAATIGVGLVSGVANGSASVGGLPVVLYFLANGAAAPVARASLVIYLLILGLIGLMMAGGAGLLNQTLAWRALLFCLPLALGVWLGSRHFLRTSPASFRRFALIVLIALALLGCLRALVGLAS